MLRKLAMVLLGVAALFVLVGLVLPRRWHVQQSVVIATSPERIHPFISSPRRWHEWQVQEKDPAAKVSFGVRDEGVGAERSWIGPKLGKGKVKVVESEPLRGVVVVAAYQSDEPNARVSWDYAPVAGGTRVTWTEDGELPPIMGGFFRSMVEESLAPQFEQGLGRLKRVVEALPPPEPHVVIPVPDPGPPDAGAADAG